MTPARILRLSSFLALAQYVAHTTLFLSAKPRHGVEEVAVIATLKDHRFDFGGFSRSYWDFYFGYGLLAILWGAVEVVLLWQIAAMAKVEPARVRPLVGLMLLANVAHALLVWRYFFAAPVVGDAMVAATLAWAFLASGPSARPAEGAGI